MYCIFSKESLARMGGNRGKMVAQAGHAYLHAFLDALSRFSESTEGYMNGPATKIGLLVETDEQLESIFESQSGCGKTKVVDIGKTVFKGVPTLTCIGIGPIDRDSVNNGPVDLIKTAKILI